MNTEKRSTKYLILIAAAALILFVLTPFTFASDHTKQKAKDAEQHDKHITAKYKHDHNSAMKLKKITVDRGKFAYRVSGNESGFPVIMLHGWPESSHCWEGVAAFMDSGYRIIAPDLRGLGNSERTLDVSAYQKVELAKDIISIVNALNIDSFYLVGHDWGGVVAQEVALAIPERVEKLVIMNIHIITNLLNNIAARNILYSQGAVPYWYQYFQQQPALAEAMIEGNEDVWVSHFFRDRPVPQESIDKYIYSYSIPNTPETGASYYRTMGQDGLRWYSLFLEGRKFTMPGLYIYGNLDSVIIPEYLIGIEGSFTSSLKIEELDSAHFVQEEKPAEVAQLLNDFFAETETVVVPY